MNNRRGVDNNLRHTLLRCSITMFYSLWRLRDVTWLLRRLYNPNTHQGKQDGKTRRPFQPDRRPTVDTQPGRDGAVLLPYATEMKPASRNSSDQPPFFLASEVASHKATFVTSQQDCRAGNATQLPVKFIRFATISRTTRGTHVCGLGSVALDFPNSEVAE